MTAQRFENLTVLSRVLECKLGCTELCRTPSGETQFLVRISDPGLQKTLLKQTDGGIPVQMNRDGLQFLLPRQEGQPLAAWLYTEKPDLRKRKWMCLSLLEQMLTQPVPPDLLAMSARAENLRFGAETLRLQLLPMLDGWERELGQAQAVRRVAGLMAQVLSDGLQGRVDEEYPDELNLLLRRSRDGEYRCWGELQSDLGRIPDELVSKVRKVRSFRFRMKKAVSRWIPTVSRIAVALLVAAAVVSAAFALRRMPEEKAEAEETWPGISQIGQETIAKEDDTA